MTDREITQAQRLARGMSDFAAECIAADTKHHTAVELLAAWIVLGDRRASGLKAAA